MERMCQPIPKYIYIICKICCMFQLLGLQALQLATYRLIWWGPCKQHTGGFLFGLNTPIVVYISYKAVCTHSYMVSGEAKRPSRTPSRTNLAVAPSMSSSSSSTASFRHHQAGSWSLRWCRDSPAHRHTTEFRICTCEGRDRVSCRRSGRALDPTEELTRRSQELIWVKIPYCTSLNNKLMANQTKNPRKTSR